MNAAALSGRLGAGMRGSVLGGSAQRAGPHTEVTIPAGRVQSSFRRANFLVTARSRLLLLVGAAARP